MISILPTMILNLVNNAHNLESVKNVLIKILVVNVLLDMLDKVLNVNYLVILVTMLMIYQYVNHV